MVVSHRAHDIVEIDEIEIEMDLNVFLICDFFFMKAKVNDLLVNRLKNYSKKWLESSGIHLFPVVVLRCRRFDVMNSVCGAIFVLNKYCHE